MLAPDHLTQVDPLEHELAQLGHRAANLGPLHDVAGGLRMLDQVVHQPVDPRRAGAAQDGYGLRGQRPLRQDAGAHGVVDVVVDIGHAIHQPHDPPLERGRGLRAPRMAEDAVAHLLGQVEPGPAACIHDGRGHQDGVSGVPDRDQRHRRCRGLSTHVRQ